MQPHFWVVSVLAFSACTKVSSQDLRTAGMSAEFKASGKASASVETSAFLHQGEYTSLNYVELKGNDALTVKVGRNEVQMVKAEILNMVSYFAAFNGENVADNEFSFSFKRTIDAGAPRSACQLPKAFEITAPTNSPTFKRSLDDFAVAYGPANTTDRIRYSLSGSCIQPKSYEVAAGDVGTFTVKKDQLIPLTDDKKMDPCDVTLSVQRYRKGSLDTGFGKGGSIVCEQERQAKLRSEP